MVEHKIILKIRDFYLKIPYNLSHKRAAFVVQMVKHPPAMQETQVQSLGQEDALEKECQSTPVFFSGEAHGQSSLAIVHRVTKRWTRLGD